MAVSASRVRSKHRSSQRGQSLLEFLLSLPLLLGLSLLVMRINTAIQIGIVGQQFARAQTLLLAYNNSTYPRLGQASRLIGKKNNQMLVGTAGKPLPDDLSNSVAEPPTYKINGKKGGGSEAQGEVAQRSDIRIRDTVTLCTNTWVHSGGPVLDFTVSGNEGPGKATGTVNLSENTKFDFCSHGTSYNE